MLRTLTHPLVASQTGTVTTIRTSASMRFPPCPLAAVSVRFAGSSFAARGNHVALTCWSIVTSREAADASIGCVETDKCQTVCADASSPSLTTSAAVRGFARRRNPAVSSRIQSQACCAPCIRQRARKVTRTARTERDALLPAFWQWQPYYF